LDNSVSIAESRSTAADIAAVQRYIGALSAIENPTAAQRTALATYKARLTDYRARYAAAIDLRASESANVKDDLQPLPPEPDL